MPTTAVETAATVETATESAAVRSSCESAGTESPIEVAEAPLAQLSGEGSGGGVSPPAHP